MTATPQSLSARLRARVADLPADVALDGATATRLVAEEGPFLAPEAAAAAAQQLLADVRGLGPLDPLLADQAVTEVMVNGPGPVWVERAGIVERSGVVVDTETIHALVERVVAPLGLRADRSAPLVDARLADGSRVNAVLPPLAVDGPCLTIRRFATRTLPVTAFAPPDVAELLLTSVRDGRNIVVSGGTSSGKTTLLNALAAVIPTGHRIVTIEDAAELRLPQPHVVRLEARPANSDGSGEVTIRQLVRNALRMRPDRIVVGECRGAEALDMLQALNTGHDGSLTTCHANGTDDALRRLETMVLLAGVNLPLLAVRDQLASAVDLIVQVARRGGRRSVVEVAEVVPTLVDGRVLTRRVAGAVGVVGSILREPRTRGAE